MFLQTERAIDISNLTCWYQPIIGINANDVLGYEAFLRHRDNIGLSPLEIFKNAQEQGERTILDCQIMIKAQQQFVDMTSSTLFLNVFPSTLLDRFFLTWWDKFSGIIPNLALEISECEPIGDWKTLKYITDALRMRGVKIAIDDMGEGYSFFKHWVELEPDYIKLNRYYMSNLLNCEKKQKILKSLVSLFHGSTNIIIQGVEDFESLELARYLGIEFAQGYALGAPAPIEKYIDTNIIKFR